ncbi:mechanosensitive ion channel family protein [Novosphingobium sp. KACC 22771]|uniref:mechanosensitive ion channel family protein n=1 Tax=Novosphingobium sp. KACC 22771 TaxID=3025670 RepID=UPI0023660B13|nr:mechanosensitive ion channel family protein [Novosphingobium sp. KACC 22771]WDF73110.1 mechanosensitive ion channel family protein [Novosphingobium sp. KACC 22771]
MSNATPTATPSVMASAHPLRPGDLRAMVQDLSNTTLNWISDYWLQIAISAAAAAAIMSLLFALRRWGRRNYDPLVGPASMRAVFAQVVMRTTTFFIVILAIRVVSKYSQMPDNLEHWMFVFFAIASVIQGAIWTRELILGLIEHRTSAKNFQGETILNAMGLIRILVSFTVFAIAAVVLLGNIGVNVTGMVAGLGVGGIAIGLAAQGIFADLFAALAIIFDRPFNRGDAISYGDSSGTIEAIGLKSTRIRAYTGELRVIANRNLLDKEVLNVSGRNHIRLPFMIGVAYETPPDTLERLPGILKELVEAEGGIAARAGFEKFGESSLDFALQVDVPGNDWPLAHDLRNRLLVAIMRRFAAEGISIPYPTQTTYTAAPDGRLIMPYAEPGQASTSA